MTELQNCCDRDRPFLGIEDVQALDELERVPCDISREEFFERYELPRRPAMLTGCAASWPAKAEWTPEKLADRFPPDSRWKATFDGRQEDWTKARWREIRRAIVDGTFFYIFDQLQDPAARSLLQDYEVPGPFQNVDLYAALDDFPAGYGKRRWFVMGSKNSGTDPHIDPSSTDAWNTALQGYKWWIIYPPSVEWESVMCDPSCSLPNLTTRHWYATVGMNASTKSSAVHVLQKPGETLYIPYGRVHSVYNFEDCVGITENYASPADVTALWQTVCQEGTPHHRRQFYFQSLNRDQRLTLRTSTFFVPSSQMGIPAPLLDLFDKYGISVILALSVALFALGALGILYLASTEAPASHSHRSIKKTVKVVKKTVKQP